MYRVLASSLLCLTTLAMPAGAAEDVQGRAHATLRAAARVNLGTTLILPTVSAVSGVSGRAGIGTGGRTGATSASTRAISNATLTIRGQSGDAMSMAVPESFTVVRSGGSEALYVRTSLNGEYGLAENGVALGANHDTMSVNIGGAVNFAEADQLVPGPYEGLLVVVVQYN